MQNDDESNGHFNVVRLMQTSSYDYVEFANTSKCWHIHIDGGGSKHATAFNSNMNIEQSAGLYHKVETLWTKPQACVVVVVALFSSSSLTFVSLFSFRPNVLILIYSPRFAIVRYSPYVCEFGVFH